MHISFHKQLLQIFKYILKKIFTKLLDLIILLLYNIFLTSHLLNMLKELTNLFYNILENDQTKQLQETRYDRQHFKINLIERLQKILLINFLNLA